MARRRPWSRGYRTVVVAAGTAPLLPASDGDGEVAIRDGVVGRHS